MNARPKVERILVGEYDEQGREERMVPYVIVLEADYQAREEVVKAARLMPPNRIAELFTRIMAQDESADDELAAWHKTLWSAAALDTKEQR